MNIRRNLIISPAEHKRILLDMLKYIDDICRKNHIHYSLIGGTLIGAIRHNGFIPWDDDVDIILTQENYNRLKQLLCTKSSCYRLLKYSDGGKQFSFTKLIDTRTHLYESSQISFLPQYGAYIDIFCYYSAPNDYKKRKKHYCRIKRLRSLLIRCNINNPTYSFKTKVRLFCRNTLSVIIGYKRINEKMRKLLHKYDNLDCNYAISNWPTYGLNNEIQLKKNLVDYIDVKFEGLTLMAFKEYDSILKTTYGNYMKLPPVRERIPRHNVKIWWRSENYDK